MRSSLALALALALASTVAACGGDDGDTPTDDGGLVDAASDGRPPTDAPVDSPGQPPIDAPVDARPVTGLNNCTAQMAVDRTEPIAPRNVMFNGGTYTPACLKIKVGQTVTWSGDFTLHPLVPGQFGGGNQPGNPIMATSTGNTMMATFGAAGDFGYYCANHAPGGMMGAIYVIP